MACASPTHAVRLSYLQSALSRAGASAPVPIRPSPSSLTNSPSRAAATAKFPWGVSPGATDGLSPPGPTIRPAPQLTPEESERKVRGGKPIGIWSDRAADAPAAPTDLKFLWHRDSRAPIRSPSGEFA
jgi:hypothetical protein